ncbi:MAG: hypothetical protein PWQ48_1563 [Thermotogaceae bacterium]|nr:hypothetical protein [Thermotogaceae bacterium]
MRKYRFLTLLLIIAVFVTLKLFPQETKEVVRIKTQKFRATEDKIIFLSRTEIEKGDTKIVADYMELQLQNGEERFVKVTDGVYVELKEGTATSNELDYDLKIEKGVMRKNVRAVFYSKDNKEKVNVECETLNIDLKNKIFSGKTDGGKVTIIKGNMFIQGERFTYDSERAVLTVEGDAFVDDKDKNRKMWAQKIVVNIDEDTIDAQEAQLEIVIETGE